MPHLLNMRHLIGTGAVALSVSTLLLGCVPAEQYQGMKMKADQAEAQLAHAQSDINAANARADANERQLQALNNGNSSQTALLTNQQQQISDLEKQNAEYNQKYANAMDMVGRAGSQALPAQLSNELSDFAAKNPDLIDFDPGRGVVKFKSDVTFPAGDAMVTPAAKAVLSKFATILNSAGADQYELLVAGNTDSTPVTNPATKKKGNFDNWYLSAHRAISVGQELIQDGVSAKRMGMLGYADKRPVASNGTAEGKTQNRRVEVLILPTSVRSSTTLVDYTPRPKRSHAAAPAPVMAPMNKDSAPAASQAPVPVMNK